MDISNLKICSFNCCSLRKNIDLVRHLADGCNDIIFLQETFITEDKLGILDFIDEDYECIGVAANYSERSMTSNEGRPEGGMAVIWKKMSHFKVVSTVLKDNFMIFKLRIGDFNLLLVNVYLNSDIWKICTLNKYLQNLSVLEDILADMEFDAIYFIGDFNADPHSGRAWQNLSSFIMRNSLKCYDVELLNSDTCTFVGYGNSQSRWLDHIVGRNQNGARIVDINVLEDVIGSDHLPLQFGLEIRNVRVIGCVPPLKGNDNSTFVNWENLKPDEFDMINSYIDSRLDNLCDHSTFHCNKIGCRDKTHLAAIDHLYSKLSHIVKDASSRFSKKFVKRNKYKVIPGWNRNVKDLYAYFRQNFLSWVRLGKPLNAIEHENMKASRKRFKDALNLTKLNEYKEKCQSIVENFQRKNNRQFWYEVKKQKGCAKDTNIVEGEVDSNKIASMFARNFLTGQSGNSPVEEREFMTAFKNKWGHCKKMYVKISQVTLKKLILNLSSGIGHDGFHSKLLRNASEKFLNIIAVFLNACFGHCYLPHGLLIGVIYPRVKDSKGNITEMSNYRPVMQSSCLLKIFEAHIINILSEKIYFSQRQFGFTSGLSTTDTCFVLKEVLFENSKSKKTGIATFIDLSKAFDKVNHFLLGHKMLDKNIPIDIVYILMHYLRNQYAKAVWKGASSGLFIVESGVRQGGVLSPFLFKFFMDDIIRDISNLKVGCMLGITRINVLAYADDLVLIACSRFEMDILYSTLCSLIEDNMLQINRNKTKCLIFNRTMNKDTPSSMELGSDTLEVVTCYKYLGHMLEQSLLDDKDVEVRLNKFYASTNSILRNFRLVDTETLLFLFKSYCMPDYGLCLWNHKRTMNRSIFKTFCVAYNNVLKKIVGAPTYSSSHITADICTVFLLNHHIALLQARYLKRLLKSRNYLIRLNLPLLKRGYFFPHVASIFQEKYNVDIFMNEVDVLSARISWIQKHEERKGPCLFYNI